MLRWAVIGSALLALAGAHQCPDGGRCQRGQTCCSSPADGYQCCPLDQAECCGDHVHCCPADTVCDASTSSCVNATASSPWVKRGPAEQPGRSRSFRMIKTYMGEDDDNICPDQSRCPAEFSCLRALTRFACCPLPQGVPCSDGRHCCPGGHRCSADGRSCIKEDVATTVVCKDGVSECPADTTCSETPEGTWGCCPLPNAACCSDKVHCCPAGYSCDLELSKCLSLTTRREAPMWAKLPARTRADWENQKEGEVPAAAGLASASSGGNEVPCDESTACPDDTTCCKTKDGGWACCPLPKAVCCTDFEHCCPNGKQCNLAEQTCEGGLWPEPWVKKISAIQRKDVQPKLVQCDESTGCPDDTTCCKTKDGGWACCPLPKAVCCTDFEHCCPNGKQCNLAEQTCEGGLWPEPWVKKIAAVQRKDLEPKLVQCDESTGCPDDTTCCKTKDGGWACCPLPKAVCCTDFEHCCPNGKQCNLAEQTCEGGLWPEPWVKKIAAVQRKDVQPKLVQCDESTGCPDDTTCCKTKDGGWACCPLPKAVCCTDFEHCCPNGKQCNLAEQTCEGGLWPEPWVKKIAAVQRKDVQPKLVQCDESTGCPDDTTCCKTKDGGWACCPLPKAVCCTDFEHCCPNGKQCNLVAETCDGGLRPEPWVKKIAAVQRKDVQPKLVQCDDTAACPDENTCCKTTEGGWGCCPLPKAVCCDNHENCCPAGTTCNLATLTCDGTFGSTPMKQKIPALTTKTHADDEDDSEEEEEEEDGESEESADEKKDDGRVELGARCSCPDFATCCPMTDSQTTGCCPLPNAVCCGDSRHCCPSGYTCFGSTCIHSAGFDWHMLLGRRNKPQTV